MSGNGTNVHSIRVASNERLFDELLDRAQGAPWRSVPLPGDFSCECSQVDCFGRIELTLSEYDAVRTERGRRAVSPRGTHVSHAAEIVLERHQAYWVVGSRRSNGAEALTELWARLE